MLTTLEFTLLPSLSAVDNSILLGMESETSFNISTEVGLTFFNGAVVTTRNLPDTKIFKVIY